MSNLLAPVARQRVFSDLGVVVPGAQLFTYVSGTPNTPQVTYFDAAGTVPNPNPVIASAGGLFPPIYLTPNLAYHFALYDNLGRLLWDQDPVQVLDGSVIPGNLVVGGILNVVGFGQHQMSAAGVGVNSLTVRNTQAGPGNFAELAVGNDTIERLLVMDALSSTFATSGPYQANTAIILSQSPVGLHLVSSDPAARVALFTNNLERMRITSAGVLLVNTTDPTPNAQLILAFDPTVRNGLAIQNVNAGNAGFFASFLNSALGNAGTIQQTGATSVAYNTASDARLKDDAGPATDLAALRALVVHDFTWKTDGVRDRGIFAQEAHALYPRAVSPGTDDRTADGSLARPWMTDYSRFVADLIVGWQQHDDAIRALEGRAR